MFTGLIEDVGRISAWRRHSLGARIRVDTAIDVAGGVALGDSIACNGVCLTALALGPHHFEADMSQETVDRSAFASAKVGDSVNIERALRLGDRLGGHMVQGHVDGVGRLVERRTVGESWDVVFELPEALLGSVVGKGSIALDGVSLTVATLEGRKVSVALVPHTGAKTTLLQRAIGSPINVETDVIGKYVLRTLERLTSGDDAGTASSGLTFERLASLGFASKTTGR